MINIISNQLKYALFYQFPVCSYPGRCRPCCWCFREKPLVRWNYFLLVDHSMVIPAGKWLTLHFVFFWLSLHYFSTLIQQINNFFQSSQVTILLTVPYEGLFLICFQTQLFSSDQIQHVSRITILHRYSLEFSLGNFHKMRTEKLNFLHFHIHRVHVRKRKLLPTVSTANWSLIPLDTEWWYLLFIIFEMLWSPPESFCSIGFPSLALIGNRLWRQSINVNSASVTHLPLIELQTRRNQTRERAFPPETSNETRWALCGLFFTCNAGLVE